MERYDPHDDLKRIAPTLHGLDRRDPFVVPEGFFDRFPHDVQAAIAAGRQRKGWSARPLFVRRIAVALPVAALLAGTWWGFQRNDGPVGPELASTPSLDELTWSEEHDLLASIAEEDLPTLGTTTLELTDDELAAYIEHQDIDLTELIAEQ